MKPISDTLLYVSGIIERNQMNDVSGKHGVTGEASSKASLSLQSGSVRKLWNALSDLELAIIDLDIAELVEGWGEPRHRPELGVKLPANAGKVYRLYDAYVIANSLLNDDEFFSRLNAVSQIEERSDDASPQVQRLPDTTNTEHDAEISRLHREIDKLTAANSRREIEISKLTIRLHQAQEKIKDLGAGR